MSVMMFKLSTVGKLFAIGAAAWLAGRTTALKIQGEKKDIEALKNALMSSKVFMDELRKPGATVDGVLEKLKLKHASASRFQAVTGIPWPL